MSIVRDKSPVTLVGGAAVPEGDLARALALAPRLVAADGGADRALALGREPVAVIGDLDSITPSARARLADRLREIAEQDSTDFDKALRSIDAPLVLALGVAGGRFDHEMAAMNVLCHHPHRPCIVIGAESLVFLTPPDVTIGLAAGESIGLFPMAPLRASSEGLEWPTDGLMLAPTGRIATSNRATGPVRLRPDVPALLTILSAERLEPAVRALARSARWPARAAR